MLRLYSTNIRLVTMAAEISVAAGFRGQFLFFTIAVLRDGWCSFKGRWNMKGKKPLEVLQQSIHKQNRCRMFVLRWIFEMCLKYQFEYIWKCYPPRSDYLKHFNSIKHIYMNEKTNAINRIIVLFFFFLFITLFWGFFSRYSCW